MQDIYSLKFRPTKLPVNTAIKIKYHNHPLHKNRIFNALVSGIFQDKLQITYIKFNNNPAPHENADYYSETDTILISEIENGNIEIKKLG